MKQVVLALLLSVVTCYAGDNEQATSKQIQDLIQSLPGDQQIRKDVALHLAVAPADEKQREANARLKKASEGFNRLRSLLRVGTSILDYPGLLALSPSSYDESAKKYMMVLGIPSDEVRANGEGPEPYMFELFFR